VTTEPKRCRGCGYILEHLPEPRCPECGRAFNSGDARTFVRGVRRGWLSGIVHTLAAALLILAAGTAGLLLGAHLWHKKGLYYASGADEALIATGIGLAGLVVCGSRRWRGRELIAATVIVGLVAYGILCWRIRPWVTILTTGWEYFRFGWWRSDVLWIWWLGKFTVLPLVVPLLLRAVGVLPWRRRRRLADCESSQ
jgi:hypothetical protein